MIVGSNSFFQVSGSSSCFFFNLSRNRFNLDTIYICVTIILNLVPLNATTVRIPPKLREEVEKYRILKRFETIAQAARMLIRVGLEIEMRDP